MGVELALLNQIKQSQNKDFNNCTGLTAEVSINAGDFVGETLEGKTVPINIHKTPFATKTVASNSITYPIGTSGVKFLAIGANTFLFAKVVWNGSTSNNLYVWASTYDQASGWTIGNTISATSVNATDSSDHSSNCKIGDIIPIGNNKAIVLLSLYDGVTTYARAQVISVSGVTCTSGTAITLSSGAISVYFAANCGDSHTADRALACYTINNSGTYTSYVYLLKVSGTTITTNYSTVTPNGANAWNVCSVDASGYYIITNAATANAYGVGVSTDTVSIGTGVSTTNVKPLIKVTSNDAFDPSTGTKITINKGTLALTKTVAAPTYPQMPIGFSFSNQIYDPQMPGMVMYYDVSGTNFAIVGIEVDSNCNPTFKFSSLLTGMQFSNSLYGFAMSGDTIVMGVGQLAQWYDGASYHYPQTFSVVAGSYTGMKAARMIGVSTADTAAGSVPKVLASGFDININNANNSTMYFWHPEFGVISGYESTPNLPATTVIGQTSGYGLFSFNTASYANFRDRRVAILSVAVGATSGTPTYLYVPSQPYRRMDVIGSSVTGTYTWNLPDLLSISYTGGGNTITTWCYGE